MITLLSRWFIRDRDHVTDPAVRRAYGQLCGLTGIGLNVLLFIGKFLAGTISGSIAITADAFNNLSDAGSSVITLLGFRLAGRKPDPEHPFGHGRIEYISGLIVSGLILLMGAELAKTSFDKILHPAAVDFSVIAMVILAVSILVKLYMSLYNRQIGKKINSAAMAATAADSISDAISTSAVLAAMLAIVRLRVPAAYLPDIYQRIDKKYKGDYARYAAELFKKTHVLNYAEVVEMISDSKGYAKLMKDPAHELSLSVMLAIFDLEQQTADAAYQVMEGDRLYWEGLRAMYPEKALYSDANFTMRLSYGSIGGYEPYDAAWYNFFTTDKGILEKADPDNDEFAVQPEILELVRSRNFGPYANAKGDLQLCFLTNNDITGGNSGSPVFDKQARLIGLAFDGNWEAMSGDIAFEPELQRCIAVDIRFVLFVIDKWGRCPRLIEELQLAR